ncbi:BMC domain-containing protein [Scopulibacillus cellulosilyticus]|uniref:BMC domain-containing protein n=1 Tax=Scopulibacillus cellulosilyticus TaxID=2665665 RepID=A0ABW2PU43_9BACL
MEQSFSLGMIETLGFPGLVAAADAAAKAADVILTYQKADSGIVTIYILGDVASVQAAVAVGEEEAKRIGQLRYSHVIARPDESVTQMINQVMDGNTANKTSQKKQADKQENEGEKQTELVKKSVSELRKLAHSNADFPLTSQEINTARKEDLIKHLSECEQEKGGDKL